MTIIAVTGASGRIGGRVARRLHAAGADLRLLVRDPSRAPHLDRAEVRAASYGSPDAISALRGADVLFMVSATEGPDRAGQHRAFVDAAAAAGVQHVVYLSFVGASPTATFTFARDHWDTEEHIKASGLAHTFLRDNLYSDLFPYLPGEDGVVRGPAGDGRVAAVAQDDIAEAAAAILQSPAAHVGSSYELTGPEALNLADVADLLTRVTGRKVTYEPEGREEAYESRRPFADAQWQLDGWVSTYLAIAAGEMAQVSNGVAVLTGHEPTSAEALLRSL